MGNGLVCCSSSEAFRRDIESQKEMSASAEELLHLQALALEIHQRHLSQRFNGSMSRRSAGSISSCKHTPTPSFRKPVPNILSSTLEAKKIILVHGEGFGAWCWYKIIPLLEEAGLCAVALDLIGAGKEHTDIKSIMTLADYSKPLLDYLHGLPQNEKVILLGHSCGGASVSYALECFPKKITKAIFLSATMVLDGQRAFDVFADEPASADFFIQESQLLLYANGEGKPPSGVMFDKLQLKGLYFNQSSSKDIALASVSMRPFPIAPIMEKLSFTAENYGSVPRYFIQTQHDRLLSPDIQEKLVRENPPREVFDIKGSDHCPFFSKPQFLSKILLQIAQLTT